jgi:DNA-binding LacI/PurR family transcriptional regulator
MQLQRAGNNEKVYARLETELRQMIYNNELSYTLPLSSEAALSKAYNISRESVRKALRNLVAEGLLKKVNGSGTFVLPPQQRRNAKNKQLHILILGPDSLLDNPLGAYDRELIAGLIKYSRSNEHKYTLSGFNRDIKTLVKDFDALRFDGIIWDRPPENYVKRIHRLQEHGIPQITLNTAIPSIPLIMMDFERSIDDILYFLRALGHDNIMFIDEACPYEERYKGRRDIFMEQLRAGGHPAPEKMFMSLNKNVSPGDPIWKNLTRASAVILANVSFYRKFKQFCENNALKIPEDMTVVVHLDHDELKTDKVCGYSHGRQEMGRRAFAGIEKLCWQDMVPQQALIPGDLIARRSYALKRT